MRKLCKVAITIAVILVVLIAYIKLKGQFEKDILLQNEAIGQDNPFILQNDTYVTAHRMGAELYPEDTLMSAYGLIQDIENGMRVDAIETDIQMTKDGELILLHDDTLDRTTNASEYFGQKNNKAIEHTLSELKDLNFGESFENRMGEYPYKGLRDSDIPDSLRVCTVNELLSFMEANGTFRYILEIKDNGETGFRAADKLVDIITEMNLIDQVIVASFHQEILDYLDDNYPQCHRNASTSEVVSFYLGWLFNRKPEEQYPYDVLDITPNYGIITGSESFGQRYGLLRLNSQGFINRAHSCGLSVFYWTVNDASVFRGLKSVDADGIITDEPNLNNSQ